jgi:hypothetical protein
MFLNQCLAGNRRITARYLESLPSTEIGVRLDAKTTQFIVAQTVRSGGWGRNRLAHARFSLLKCIVSPANARTLTLLG